MYDRRKYQPGHPPIPDPGEEAIRQEAVDKFGGLTQYRPLLDLIASKSVLKNNGAINRAAVQRQLKINARQYDELFAGLRAKFPEWAPPDWDGD